MCSGPHSESTSGCGLVGNEGSVSKPPRKTRQTQPNGSRVDAHRGAFGERNDKGLSRRLSRSRARNRLRPWSRCERRARETWRQGRRPGNSQRPSCPSAQTRNSSTVIRGVARSAIVIVYHKGEGRRTESSATGNRDRAAAPCGRRPARPISRHEITAAPLFPDSRFRQDPRMPHHRRQTAQQPQARRQGRDAPTSRSSGRSPRARARCPGIPNWKSVRRRQALAGRAAPTAPRRACRSRRASPIRARRRSCAASPIPWRCGSPATTRPSIAASPRKTRRRARCSTRSSRRASRRSARAAWRASPPI